MATLSQKVAKRAERHYGITVLMRSEWNSTEAGRYAERRVSRRVKVRKAPYLVQHITVTRPVQIRKDMRALERIGVDRFGSGVSYNFCFDMSTGTVAAGMPLDAKGTHTVNAKSVPGYPYDLNAFARAFAVIGMEDTPLSPRCAESMARMIAAMMDVGALTKGVEYLPHSHFAPKGCPCDATRSEMADILERAKALRKMKRREIPPLRSFSKG